MPTFDRIIERVLSLDQVTCERVNDLSCYSLCSVEADYIKPFLTRFFILFQSNHH